MRTLLYITACLCLIASNRALALGTTAGTDIQNQATVTYSSGAGTVTALSNTVSVKVDELVRGTLQSQDNSKEVSVAVGTNNAAMKFQLTNTGNGNEAFKIDPANLTGDQFDTGTFTVYLDAIGNGNEGSFNVASDTLLNTGITPTLSPDESITLWIVTNIPTGLVDADRADVQVSVTSETFNNASNTSPTSGDVVLNGGDNSTHAVYGVTTPFTDTATFIVSAVGLTITKAISAIRDNLGQSGAQPVPGAEVDYVLTVNISGTGTANSVIITDPLPSQLLLKDTTGGIITVDSVQMTANTADSDDASYDQATNTITVNLGDVVVNGSNATSTIQFTAVIQ